IASACGPRGFAAPDSSTWRIASAPAEPPGSRLTTTLKPSACKRLASSDTCVDLPAPSPPSKVMNFPRISRVGKGLQPIDAGAEHVDDKLARGIERALVQAAGPDILTGLQRGLHD